MVEELLLRTESSGSFKSPKKKMCVAAAAVAAASRDQQEVVSTISTDSAADRAVVIPQQKDINTLLTARRVQPCFDGLSTWDCRHFISQELVQQGQDTNQKNYLEQHVDKGLRNKVKSVYKELREGAGKENEIFFIVAKYCPLEGPARDQWLLKIEQIGSDNLTDKIMTKLIKMELE